MTWNKQFAANVIKLRKLSAKFTEGFVVYSGDLTPVIRNTLAFVLFVPFVFQKDFMRSISINRITSVPTFIKLRSITLYAAIKYD